MKELTDKPLFQFKKPTSRRIGDFDVNDKTLFSLLIKKEIQDFPKFLHFEKMWNTEETSDQLDGDGNIIIPGKKAHPAYKIVTGFIRDDKHIITNQKTIQDGSYAGIHKKYLNHLQGFINQGYVKDVDQYVGEEPNIPTYYVNEKTPMVGQEMNIGNAAVNVMNLMQTSNQGANIPVAIANKPPKNPLLKLFPPKRVKGGVIGTGLQTSQAANNQNP